MDDILVEDFIYGINKIERLILDYGTSGDRISLRLIDNGYHKPFLAIYTKAQFTRRRTPYIQTGRWPLWTEVKLK